MKLILTLIVFSIVISGCTTAGELRQKAVVRQHKNMGNEKDVAICINEKWEKIVINGVVQIKPLKNGYSVTWSGTEPMDTLAIADVTDTNTTGSITSFFSARERSKFFEAVVSCQNG